MIDQVREFHKTFAIPIAQYPCIPSDDRLALRRSLITEEYKELMEALGTVVQVTPVSTCEPNLIGIADGACDLHYVISGTSLECGLPENELFAEVQRSNMSKANEDGTVIRREDGKILKSSCYSPPDLKFIIEKASEEGK